MKSFRLIPLLAVFLGWLPSAPAQSESLASILTNTDTRVIPARRPSIIYIQWHGLGYGDLSCYGQTNFFTPNLDRLAKEGLRFTRFRPGATNFTEALAVLLGGRGPRTGQSLNLAERLQQAGYHTGLLGEWTLGPKPWRQGFNEFAGFVDGDAARNYYPERLWRFAPKSIFNPTNATMEDFEDTTLLYENTGGQKGRYLPEVLANATANFVRNNQPEEANRYRPFFLLVNLPAPASATPGADDFPVPSAAPYTSEKWPEAAKNRAALITRLDGGIGRLLEKMKEISLTNNVVIFFSSAAAPAPFANAKMNFLNPHGNAAAAPAPAPAPLIVHWPGAVPAGQVSEVNWSAEDLAPTLLDIAYARRPVDLPGTSRLPLLLGKQPKLEK